MAKEKTSVDFDLSTLSLQELIEVYENIDDFLEFLNESKLELEEEGNANE